MPVAKRGRPAGLLLNPRALEDLLGERSQRWLAEQIGVPRSVLNQFISGNRGVTDEVAARLAETLGCQIGTLFPEAVGFTCQVRVFTHSGVDQ